MSLIAGVLNLDGTPAEARFLGDVLQGFQQYGPERNGAWAEGPLALGHLMRFSTPESLGERLPLASGDGRWAITCDARIDNRSELFEALDVARTERRGMPDSELILRAWSKWESDCPSRLEGDFALAVYDRLRRELFLARSAFCAIPLYYAFTRRCFAFASLARPLLVLARLPKRLNERSFANYATHAAYSLEAAAKRREPLFEGVESLAAATTLRVRHDGSQHSGAWWRPDPSAEIRLGHESDYYEGVRELTIRAVHDRMRSRQPVMCYLSGGLDSSTITSIAAQKLRGEGKRLTTLSSVLPPDHRGPEADERHFIDIVRRAEDLDAMYVHPRQGFCDAGAAFLDVLEHPGANPKHYVYAAFYEAARQRGAGILLDGCGGEVGPTAHARGLFAWLARAGQWGALTAELRCLSQHTNQSMLRLLLRHVLAPHLPRLQAWHQRLKNPSQAIGPVELPLNADFVARHGLTKRFVPQDRRGISQRDPKQGIRQAIEHLQRGAGCDASTAYGLRTWYPFFDRRLIQFCLGVPARLYHVGGWSRNLIRRAMHGILPPEIQWRKCKTAFSPDYYRRFQSEWHVLRDEFAAIPTGDPVRDYYDLDSILKTMDELRNRPGAEMSPEGLRVKLCIQSSLAGIRFLRWFERVNVSSQNAAA